MNMWAICWLLAGHFVGDFILQTRHQANNKHRYPDALVSHASVYALTVTVAFLVASFPLRHWAAAILGISLISHGAVDAVTSRITHWAWNHEPKKEKLFFCIIGADQMIHMITVFGTYWILMNLR